MKFMTEALMSPKGATTHEADSIEALAKELDPDSELSEEFGGAEIGDYYGVGWMLGPLYVLRVDGKHEL